MFKQIKMTMNKKNSSFYKVITLLVKNGFKVDKFKNKTVLNR